MIGVGHYNHFILGGDAFALGVEEDRNVPAHDKSIRMPDPTLGETGFSRLQSVTATFIYSSLPLLHTGLKIQPAITQAELGKTVG